MLGGAEGDDTGDGGNVEGQTENGVGAGVFIGNLGVFFAFLDADVGVPFRVDLFGGCGVGGWNGAPEEGGGEEEEGHGS